MVNTFDLYYSDFSFSVFGILCYLFVRHYNVFFDNRAFGIVLNFHENYRPTNHLL